VVADPQVPLGQMGPLAAAREGRGVDGMTRGPESGDHPLPGPAAEVCAVHEDEVSHDGESLAQDPLGKHGAGGRRPGTIARSTLHFPAGLGRRGRQMNCRVDDLMVSTVVSTTRHRSVGHVRELLARHRIHALPVVDDQGAPIGILTTIDLMNGIKDETRVDQVMTKPVLTVPRYEDITVAARMMRNRRVHHLIVVHEKKLVGMLSSFDILRLVEDHRFAARGAPPKGNRKKFMNDLGEAAGGE